MRLNNRSASHEALVDNRRARVASFKVQGLSIRNIILALVKDKCINPDTGKPWQVATVQADLKHLEAIWQATALRDITQVKADELAKLDELEREAWLAWRRGIGRKQVRTTKIGGKDGTEISLKTETLNGDPRYLAIVLDCQQRRARMFGLDAPTKIAETDADGNDLTDDARAILRTRLLGG
jgi:hypothetical protein